MTPMIFAILVLVGARRYAPTLVGTPPEAQPPQRAGTRIRPKWNAHSFHNRCNAHSLTAPALRHRPDGLWWGEFICPMEIRLRGYTSDILNRLEDGVIIPTKLPSTQPFAGGEATNLNGVTILEYWQWAYSGIVGNTDRGNLAEFLVAKALAIATDVRNDWADFDLTTTDKTKIEVKSSAFVQSWKQIRLYSPRFSIKKTLSLWNLRSENLSSWELISIS